MLSHSTTHQILPGTETVTGAASGMAVGLHLSLLLGSLPELFSGTQVRPIVDHHVKHAGRHSSPARPALSISWSERVLLERLLFTECCAQCWKYKQHQGWSEAPLSSQPQGETIPQTREPPRTQLCAVMESCGLKPRKS